MLTRISNSSNHGYTSLNAQADTPAVRQDLNIANADAVRAEKQRLIQRPELRALCERACNGANIDEAVSAFADLMLYAHADARQENPDAMLEPALRPRQIALATLADHLSPTSTGALRQTLYLPADTSPFSPFLDDAGRRCLTAQTYHREGDALLTAGQFEQAAIQYETGARALEQGGAQQTLAAHLYRQCANALKQADQPLEAAKFYRQAAEIEFERAQTVGDEVDPTEFVTRAVASFAAAAAMFARGNDPDRAIEANAKAADLLNSASLHQQAIGFYLKVAEACSALAAEHRQAAQHAQADAAAMKATHAWGNAAANYWELHDYTAAAPLFSRAGQHDWAAKCYEQLATRDEDAGRILAAAQNCGMAARARAEAGQHDQAAAHFWHSAALLRQLNHEDPALEAELAAATEQALAVADTLDQEELAAAAQAAKQQQWQQLVASFGGPPEPAVITSINTLIAKHLTELKSDGFIAGSYKFLMDDEGCIVTYEQFDPHADTEWCAIVMDPRNGDGSPLLDGIRTVKFLTGPTAQDLVQNNSKHLILPGRMHAGDMLRGPTLLNLLLQPAAQPMGGQ